MINENCPCKTASCPRHGHCDECVSYHGTHAKSPFTSCGKTAAAPKPEIIIGEKASEEN